MKRVIQFLGQPRAPRRVAPAAAAARAEAQAHIPIEVCGATWKVKGIGVHIKHDAQSAGQPPLYTTGVPHTPTSNTPTHLALFRALTGAHDAYL